MKKKMAMMLSLLLMTSPAPMTASADGAYCPEGLPVADWAVEYVDAETAAVLFDMRDQLLKNVYVNYPDTEVHAVSASDIVGKVYVMYTSDTQAELDAAKAYCEANGFDMDIMQFYLYDESRIVPELGDESEGSPATENTPMAGDISADNALGLLDAVYLQKYLLNAAQLNEAQYQRADVDLNHTVDVFDLAVLKRVLINKT